MPLFKAAREALAPIFRPAGTMIEGVTPGDWASPMNPIVPITPPGMTVRGWDFYPGLNLNFIPRGDSPINFAQLRSMANSFDLCRLMIETRKDQVVNRPWSIRVKAKQGELKKDRAKRQASNPNVTRVTDLLRRPDGVHPFNLWLRMWMDQLLVYDAPCIYPVRSIGGDVLALRIISGATITPLVDENGFIPQPPNPAYQQIILGIPTSNLQSAAGVTENKRDLLASQLIYSPRNPRCDSRWGFSPVEQIITTLQIAANWQNSTKFFFTEGNVPEGFMPMPEGWTPGQIKDFQTWLDAKLAGNLRQKRRLIATPDTKHPVQMTKERALIDPATSDYVTRVVAFAFSITPQNLIKQVNRGTAKESSDVAQMEGLEPTLKHIETVMTMDVIENVLGIQDVEFAFEEEREMDPLKQAQADDLNLRNASATINQVREARGLDPLPNPEANEPGIYTATGWLALGQTAQPAEPNEGEKKTLKSGVYLRAGDLTPNSRRWLADAQRSIGGFLKSQHRRVIEDCVTGLQKVAKGDLENDTDRALAILAMIRWNYPELYEIAAPLLEASAREGATAGAYQMAARSGGSLAVEALAKAEAENWAKSRAASLVGARIDAYGSLVTDESAQWAVSQTAKADVDNTIRMAITEGWTPKQLQAVLEGSALFTQAHADLIASQEITRSQAMGHYIAWRESRKVKTVQWRTSPLHKCCDVCDAYEAKGDVPAGHEFAKGVFAPPDAHPNCECYLEVREFEDEP